MTYSGNHGVHLIDGGYNINQLDPALALKTEPMGADPVANPYARKGLGPWGAATDSRNQTMLPYPWLGGAIVRTPHLGNSIYDALLLSARATASAEGLTLLASYTWAKLLSDSVINPLGTGFGDEQANETGYQNSYNRRAERAEDPTNISQRAVLSAVYELPFGKGQHFHVG